MKLSLQEINNFDDAKDFLVYASNLSDNRIIELKSITKWSEDVDSVVFHMYVDENGISICDISVFDEFGGWKDNIKATNEEINQVNDFLCTLNEYCDYCNNENNNISMI